MRDILGLGREWRVIIVGAGKIGAALAQYHGFQQRGFSIVAAYDSNPEKIGRNLDGVVVRDITHLERDVHNQHADIAVLAVPEEHAQRVGDRIVHAGIKAILLNFAGNTLQVPPAMSR